jgi:hypothetical protein
MLADSQASLFIPHSIMLLPQLSTSLVGVLGIDLLARHLLEHAACAVGDLLVLVAA